MHLSWKALPYILLVCYVIYICCNFYNFKERFDYALERPVHVLQDAREIKTRLGEMRNTLPGLMSTRDISYDEILKILKSQEDMQDASFASMKQLFSGNPEYIRTLEEAMTKIRALRRQAARTLDGNNDYNKAMDLYNSLILPQVGIMNNAVNEIILYAQKLLREKQAQTRQDMVWNIALTIIMGLFISLAFIAVNLREKNSTSQLRDRDRLFYQLSENVDEVFIIASSEDEFDYVTYNSARLLNLDSRDIQARPEKLYIFFPPDDAAWLRETTANASALDAPAERMVVFDNGYRAFRLCVYPCGGIGQHVIISIGDRTKDFQQRQALSDALENAHTASKAKSSFLSHMSHEIRTPMNAIIGMTTIALSKMDQPDRVAGCLGKIAEASRHLLHLINDVLDMSKIENGKLSICREQFSLPDCIRKLNDLVRPQAEERQLEFEIFQENVDEDELVGDLFRLNQILINIISNSLKFTPAHGRVSLTIKQLRKRDKQLRLAFVVADTGIGMSEEFLAHVYKPFEQASAGTAAKYGGTGLGMSITFNLISLLGGTIRVESDEGRGTTFTVELPFEYTGKTVERASDLPKLKVLVTDDDHGTCEHAALLLEKMGLEASWCTSGREAVELVRKGCSSGAPFDVCLLDWKMPEMDGAETAKKIREAVGDDMLIIIISAYDWTPIEEKAREAGVNAFVGKPFFASTLYDALSGATRNTGKNKGKNQETDTSCDLAGKRILLVEDNDFNREIAQEFLDMSHATVETAENGREAVDMFNASAPGYYDLVLMDVQMPLMDGYEATRAIRAASHADARKIPILAMTANAFSEDVANAMDSGMNDHIAKPIDVNDLFKMLRKYLQS